MDTISSAVPLDDITHWAPPGACSRLQMLRLDKLHPVVSGNKWFKLRYNIEAAKTQRKLALLTFGGGYSNHLVATAFAAQIHGLRSIGIVRGHYAGAQLTPTLRACAEYGMQLLPFTKADYAAASTDNGARKLAQDFPSALIIPEGGANEAGVRGAAGIGGLIPPDVTDVCVAVGTGTTLAGLHAALPEPVRLHGFCAARHCDTARSLIAAASCPDRVTFHSVADPRFGKWTGTQIAFMRAFYGTTGIPLDVVYTGKMMMAVLEMLEGGYFRDGRVLCIHTGGLQGNPPELFH